ncbi:MAG: type IX secretion system sortase PorU [Ignavibacteriales bacterium]|nr:type IX secretion system sortase PorU [Ignavibacteriales bacterium]
MKSKISLIFLPFLFTILCAQQDFKVISSSKNSLIIEYKPHYDSSYVQINNEKYLKLSLKIGNQQLNSEPGLPEIPVRVMTVGVPSETGNTIQVIGSSYVEKNAKLSPVPKAIMEDGLLYYSYDVKENYSQKSASELVSFSDFGLTRNLPVQSITISPVQFEPIQYVIRLYTKIIFRINFAASKSAANVGTDDFNKDAVINYGVAKNWQIETSSLLKKQIVNNSVLSSGKWYRFETPDEGIYIINKTTLAAIGIDPATVDPRTIKIYNNGGKVLSENILTARPQDLVENAIFVNGESDGKFDDGDYILFYGRGINFWEYDATTKKVIRFYHNYSRQNYYWITYGGNTGKRMESKSSLNSTPDNTQLTTDAYYSWEEDKAKILPSGRLYVGDEFTEVQRVRQYPIKLDGIVSGSTVSYRFNFANRSELDVPLKIDENGTNIYFGTLFGLGIGNLENAEGLHGTQLTINTSFHGALPDDRSLLRMDYEPTRSPSIGYLNYYEIYYNRNLTAANNELQFYSQPTPGITEYHLSGFPSSDIKIFDITNFSDAKLISETHISGGDCVFQSSEVNNSISKYLAIGNSVYKTPINFTSIDNSNLHGIADGAKFIIITNSLFKEQAERYKVYKESNSLTKMSTVVVEVDKIFNEFSGGLQDVSAIRDFIKYAYDNWNIKPEYVLLFGDGDYDYKNVEEKSQNFVIPYESLDSFSAIGSYCSDDFYVYVSGNDRKVDLAIGRLNVTTVSEAKDMVDKIIRYETQSEFGLWRNLITLVADDEIGAKKTDESSLHTGQSESLSSSYIPSSYDQKKIYLTVYPTVETAIGRRKPSVNKAIIEAANEGTVIMNWIGHGNPDVWAHEYVFEKSVTIPQMLSDKYFFLTAATCDFGRYDVPGIQSSTELMILKPDGGSIGTFSAARTVYAQDNAAINQEFYSNLFRKDSLNLISTIGKAYYLTKLEYFAGISNNDLKFHLFGDPTLRLLVPQLPSKVDSINGSALTSKINIKALSNIKIDGTVRTPHGQLDNNFNGEAVISVYDSERLVLLTNMHNYPMTVQGGVIYKGRVSVINGKYSTSFIVPKDISYENKSGKIVGYLSNSSSDAISFSDSIIVGGTDYSITDDKKGPEMEISFDNAASENSYLVNSDCTLLVKLKDQTGLNTTGNGIGHTLSGILNENENAPLDFTNYFVGDLNANGKSGFIKYNFYGLDFGDYKIQVKAWDVFNNYSSAEKTFTVVNGSDLVLRDVVNYPNPFRSNTTFTFQHNLSQPVSLKIKVYTVAGRLIKALEESNISDKFVKVDWDGRDDDGNTISNGVYLYKLIVKTLDGKLNREVLGKLAVIK